MTTYQVMTARQTVQRIIDDWMNAIDEGSVPKHSGDDKRNKEALSALDALSRAAMRTALEREVRDGEAGR